MTVGDQYALFQVLIGDNPTDPRFSMDQFIILINAARRWFCEQTKCFQVEDEQPSIVGTSIYTLQVDMLDVEAVEFNGVEIDLVRPKDWRSMIGTDDTIQGQPSVAKVWARQVQLFYVPSSIANIKVTGRAYCANLVANGGDTDLTDQQATGAVTRAAWICQMVDKEDYSGLKNDAETIAAAQAAQYRPKGPRYARGLGPYRGFLPGGSLNV